MQLTLIIALATCLAMILLILIKPSLKIGKKNYSTYWMVAIMGAIVLLCTKCISPREVLNGLTNNSSINPLKILVLFISMTVLSIFLDEMGLFRYLANQALKRAKSSQYSLFTILYIIVSILTMFTSNDIVILTITPFICYFAKNAKINPIPYLVAEFIAANTWSMIFIIGNPTNIYLATSAGITFLEYFKIMALPTICGGLVSYLLLLALFHKQLKKPLQSEFENVTIKNKPLLIVGIICLSLCTLALAISNYIGLEMYLISLSFATIVLLISLIYYLVKKQKPTVTIDTIKKAPWSVIPFIIGMFTLVLSLNKYDVTKMIQIAFGTDYAIFKYGISSFVMCNLINNIPMSVFYSSVVSYLDAPFLLRGTYAAIIGSNLGAYLTPIGSLAGIMWMGLVKNRDVKFSFIDFVKYNGPISIAVLLASLGSLYFILSLI